MAIPDLPPRRSFAIVGVGVRGLVILTRIAALLEEHPGVTLDIHLIDPWPDGGGRTWRTDQSPLMLMNGPASVVTAYPGDDPAGPGLLDWCRGIANGSIAVDLPETYRAEAVATTTQTYPTRALYGWYLRWVQQRTLRALPDDVRVHRHEATVTDLAEGGETIVLRLSDATELVIDGAVLALGWLPRQHPQPPTRPDRWIPPLHAVDQDLRGIEPGSTVFLRGLGMNFFDSVVLLTEGRGGRFVADGEARLRYEPSGREPVLLAGSRRGVPFRTKPPVPPSAGVVHDELNRVLAEHPAGTPWNFADDVVPAVRLDALHSYYAALTQQRPEGVPDGLHALVSRLREAGPDGAAAVLAECVPDPTDRLDLDALQDPAAGRHWPDHASWHAWLISHLEADLHEARSPGSPLRAAMRSIGETRLMIASVIERDGLTSHGVPAYQGLMRLGASLAGGPPPIRAAQVLALLEAGVLEILGPQPQLEHVGDDLVVGSARVEGAPRPIDVLLDAHVDPPDAVNPGDPLLRSLVQRGLARAHRFGDVPSGAVEVELPSGRLVRADGTVHERVFLVGIPSEGQRVFTILSPKSGGDSAILRECEAVAIGLLETALEPVAS